MAGVSFRFAQIKDLLYSCSIAGSDAARLLQAPLRSTTPELVPLCTNYRSHSGLLRVAAAVVRVVIEVFPGSVDELSPDCGVFEGPLPTLLLSSAFGELLERLQPSLSPGGAIALRKSQAVLVRDDATRMALLATDAFAGAGDRIFTVASSKGREWDDVCLINFFEGSADILDGGKRTGKGAKVWRMLINLLNSGAAATRCGLDDTGAVYEGGRPRGSGTSLAAVPLDDKTAADDLSPLFETELKALYVALTRARSRLWLWEGPIPAKAPHEAASSYRGAAAAPFFFLQRCALVAVVFANATADIAPFVVERGVERG